MKTTEYGFTATLQRHNRSPWPNDVMTLKLDIFLETQDRIRIKVNGSSVWVNGDGLSNILKT